MSESAIAGFRATDGERRTAHTLIVRVDEALVETAPTRLTSVTVACDVHTIAEKAFESR